MKEALYLVQPAFEILLVFQYRPQDDQLVHILGNSRLSERFRQHNRAVSYEEFWDALLPGGAQVVAAYFSRARNGKPVSFEFPQADRTLLVTLIPAVENGVVKEITGLVLDITAGQPPAKDKTRSACSHQPIYQLWSLKLRTVCSSP